MKRNTDDEEQSRDGYAQVWEGNEEGGGGGEEKEGRRSHNLQA